MRDANDPLASWRGDFGTSYIRRNQATADITTEAADVFRRVLGSSGLIGHITSVLEVGANVGINLIALRQILGPEARLSAVEPNPEACEVLRRNAEARLESVFETDAYRIPVDDNSFDLTFTNGVLIHVPPARLPDAMREIVRVSKRFVLTSEYFSHVPVEIPYRGQSGLLWKRDFGSAYLETCAALRPRQYGFLWQTEFPHFDNLNWWMFEKQT
jgi:pseudaminic acid biosynthesis-associated methylase